ncbi:hypothetical protein AEA09_05075 [Lysinibacillus contaminans]|uniref:Uncharacterized protein n=1 Tax=Lysinibacillus contaminans TaxID=1293441 RepID=A0ABR5JZR8_9BACI|nr:hypothetical protein [Lysinibacillus contaminans]KOS67990.1 hypothetical protein AEA09_05075 [Lysinibacillus contaminans]
MEQLILFAIIAIVTSLFGKAKNKDQKQMPSFDKDAKQQPPVVMNAEEPKTNRPTMKTQSFEDFARTFLGDVQDETDVRKKRVKPIPVEVVEQTPSYVAPPLIPTEVPGRKMQRSSIGRMAAGKKEVRVTSTNKTFKLPTSKQSLMQAIVMAEVLGPPKAKRK